MRGNHFGPHALTGMEEFEHRAKPPVTAEERAAKKEKSALEAEQALKERKKADDAFRANFERLKAERLAREAAELEARLRIRKRITEGGCTPR